MGLLLLLVALLLLAGCSSRPTRGDLSEAMHASATGTGGSDRDAGRSSRPASGGSTFFDERARTDSSRYRDQSSLRADDLWDEAFWHIPVDFTYLMPLNSDIRGIGRFAITPIGFADWRNFAGVYIGGGWVNLKHGSLPDRAISNARMLEIGASYRRYFNDSHVFLSPYIAANLAWQPLFWDYRNTIVVDDARIHSDWVHGINAYTGLGVATERSHRLSFFGEAGFGGIVYGNTTREGFRNDVFDDFLYFGVKAGITWQF